MKANLKRTLVASIGPVASEALRKYGIAAPIDVHLMVRPVDRIVPDFAKLIRAAREKTGMNQAAFAQKLNEKESIIQKLESGAITPPVSLARKLEKTLRITLVTIEKDEQAPSERAKKSGPLTIGDLIKIKK